MDQRIKERWQSKKEERQERRIGEVHIIQGHVPIFSHHLPSFSWLGKLHRPPPPRVHTLSQACPFHCFYRLREGYRLTISSPLHPPRRLPQHSRHVHKDWRLFFVKQHCTTTSDLKNVAVLEESPVPGALLFFALFFLGRLGLDTVAATYSTESCAQKTNKKRRESIQSTKALLPSPSLIVLSRPCSFYFDSNFHSSGDLGTTAMLQCTYTRL